MTDDSVSIDDRFNSHNGSHLDRFKVAPGDG